MILKIAIIKERRHIKGIRKYTERYIMQKRDVKNKLMKQQFYQKENRYIV